jgi:hypothetical protein
MELIERYLQAVKFWLPKEQKSDIIAELSEDLRSQIEERETALGRKLNEAEIGAILKERGRPLLVANRYQPQQYLIGPVLFPIYRFVLKIVALCYLLPWVIVWLCVLSFSPAYRAEHGNWVASALAGWSSLWVVALSAFGVVTMVFAALERAQAKSLFLEKWNPRKLPPVRDPNRIQRSASSLELAANFAFLISWIAYISPRTTILNRPEIRISLSPAWSLLFWGFLLLATLNLALAGANLMRPYWTGLRATLRLASDAIGSALFCWFLKVGILTEIAVRGMSPEKALQIRDVVNLWMLRSFPIAVIVGVVIAAVNIYRIIRVTGNDRRLTPGVPVTVV